MSVDTAIPWIDVDADTGSFVSALLKAPAGTQVEGASEYLSARDYMKLWTEHLGVHIEFAQASAEEFIGEDPTGLKRMYTEAFLFTEDFGYFGGDPAVKSADQVRVFPLKSATVVADAVTL